MVRGTTDEFDAARYLSDDADSPYYVDAETDGGDDYPRTYGGDSEHGTVVDAITELQPGDRVLWGDRSVPCVVARVVDSLNDRIGYSLTASVVRPVIKNASDRERWEESDLRAGDVFMSPDRYGGLYRVPFAIVQGPRGGFYAIGVGFQNGRKRPILFRAVRTFHSSKLGQPGKGAWTFQKWGPETLEVVESGDAPEELDPVGDLPSYEEIRDSRLVTYDKEADEHYAVAETVEEAFDRGLRTAYDEAASDREAEKVEETGETSAWRAVPDPEDVNAAGTPSGHSHSGVYVTDLFESEYGDVKAVLDAPAPWETPDGETPFNEAIKKAPWEDTHRTFDSDREAWTIDAEELVRVASLLADFGFSTYDERADEE